MNESIGRLFARPGWAATITITGAGIARTVDVKCIRASDGRAVSVHTVGNTYEGPVDRLLPDFIGGAAEAACDGMERADLGAGDPQPEVMSAATGQAEPKAGDAILRV